MNDSNYALDLKKRLVANEYKRDTKNQYFETDL